jgi:dihydroorotate dehydrogenase
MFLYGLARPVLFSVDAEYVHELSISALARHPRIAGILGARTVEAPVRLMGL